MYTTRVLVGFHAVTARLRRNTPRIAELLVDGSRRDPRILALEQLAAERGARVQHVDGAHLDGLAGGLTHQGVVATLSGDPGAPTLGQVLESIDEPALLLLLDGVQDPHNLGACLRCADAFGAHAVVLPKDRAVGVNATVSKVASGAAETVPVIEVTNLARSMRELKDHGIWLIGADAGGSEVLSEAPLEGPLAWVLGGEGKGLRRLTRELCDRMVRIRQHGSVPSLNVSVAAGICLFETRRQRSLVSEPAPSP